MRRRWRLDLLALGEDPDPRFTLANERTFLAWIRTSLALVAGGIGLDTFVSGVMPAPVRATIAALLLVLGAVVASMAFVRWLAAERSLRLGRPLPLPAAAPLLSLGVGAVAGALVVAVMLGQFS